MFPLAQRHYRQDAKDAKEVEGGHLCPGRSLPLDGTEAIARAMSLNGKILHLPFLAFLAPWR